MSLQRIMSCAFTRMCCRSVWDDYEADTEPSGAERRTCIQGHPREDQQPVAIKVIGRDTKAFKQQPQG